MDKGLTLGIVHGEKIPNWIIGLLALIQEDKIFDVINFHFHDSNELKSSINGNIFLKIYLAIDNLVNKKYRIQTANGFEETQNQLNRKNISVNNYSNLKNAENSDLILWLTNPGEIPNSLVSIKYGVWYSNLDYNKYYNLTLLSRLILKKDTINFRLSIKSATRINIHSSSYRLYDKSYIKSLYNFEENLINIIHSKILKLSEINNINAFITNSTIKEDIEVQTKHIINTFNIINLLYLFFLEKFRNIIMKEQWFLVLVSNDIKNAKAIKYSPSLDKFWADPFLFTLNNNEYLFFEEYEEETGKGNISFLKLGENLEIIEKPKVIIKKPYHLSYPFIFEYNKCFYMIPETSENHAIELYKATSFPDQWAKEKNLMENIYALDSSLFHYNDLWWMFANIKKTKSASSDSDLYLFFAQNPIDGQWKEHPKNPIVTSVKSARPAGRIYQKGNRLFRPSQDCSKRYGYGLVINEIQTLTTAEYEEKKIERVTPSRSSIIALHTINTNSSKSIVAFDAMNRVNKFFSGKNKKIKSQMLSAKNSYPFIKLSQQL